jgi:hypothetical protein
MVPLTGLEVDVRLVRITTSRRNGYMSPSTLEAQTAFSPLRHCQAQAPGSEEILGPPKDLLGLQFRCLTISCHSDSPIHHTTLMNDRVLDKSEGIPFEVNYTYLGKKVLY